MEVVAEGERRETDVMRRSRARQDARGQGKRAKTIPFESVLECEAADADIFGRYGWVLWCAHGAPTEASPQRTSASGWPSAKAAGPVASE